MASATAGYYWKIYDGTTPEDAVEGGVDVNGTTFYIGLCHLKLVNEILAGMIIPSLQAAHITSFAISLYIKTDIFNEVKILCSANKEAFEWIPTTSEELHLLTHHDLVPGGNVLGQNLYIGRIRRRRGGFILGKVFPDKFVYRGLYIPAGCTHFQYLTFCVLAFNTNKIKKQEEAAIEETRSELSGNDGVDIDVRQKGDEPEPNLDEEETISRKSNNNSTPISVCGPSEQDLFGNAASKEILYEQNSNDGCHKEQTIPHRSNNNSKPVVVCPSEDDLTGNTSKETLYDEKPNLREGWHEEQVCCSSEENSDGNVASDDTKNNN